MGVASHQAQIESKCKGKQVSQLRTCFVSLFLFYYPLHAFQNLVWWFDLQVQLSGVALSISLSVNRKKAQIKPLKG